MKRTVLTVNGHQIMKWIRVILLNHWPLKGLLERWTLIISHLLMQVFKPYNKWHILLNNKFLHSFILHILGSTRSYFIARYYFYIFHWHTHNSDFRYKLIGSIWRSVHIFRSWSRIIISKYSISCNQHFFPDPIITTL